jgi:hypothetical protein
MKKYGHESMDDADREDKSWIMGMIIDLAVIVLVVIALVVSFCGCSLTVNVASDGQPGQVIYQNTDGRME